MSQAGEALIGLLVLLLLEAAYIAIVSSKSKANEKRIRELGEKIRVIQEIHDWLSAETKVSSIIRKPRKRYIVFRVLSDRELDRNEVWSIIRRAASRLYGESFLSDSMLDLVYYEKSRRAGVLRTTNSYKDHVIGLLGLAGKGTGVVITPVKTAGTLRKAREYIY